jgi:adenine-specific DNA-methyltransferase
VKHCFRAKFLREGVSHFLDELPVYTWKGQRNAKSFRFHDSGILHPAAIGGRLAFEIARPLVTERHSVASDAARNFHDDSLPETVSVCPRPVKSMSASRKKLGQFFTPEAVAKTLVNWAVRKPSDRLLDPSCGDGEFLACHRRSVGIEIDPVHGAQARQRAPGALIHFGDFFSWATQTTERFDAAAGNPPFIRYQSFSGETRERAVATATRLGARFNGLSSSWAPFLVVAATLLKAGGRMAFVVPAEIGHATYAEPLLECLCRNFDRVGVVAIREKLFPELSEDAWLLYLDGFGGSTTCIGFSSWAQFEPSLEVPGFEREITLQEWRNGNCRLRRFLLAPSLLGAYEDALGDLTVRRFSELAHAGIGYVTGANDFFHLRPSEARLWELPKELLRVSVRKGEQLPVDSVNDAAVRRWLGDDEPVLLLDLKGAPSLPDSVKRYLATADAQRARKTYKCQNRSPWYAVPDVTVPDAFLTYLNGRSASLVANQARCVCTNSIHAVRLKPSVSLPAMQREWSHPLCQLSCELEGLPLGGGMLKLEPGEAARTRLPVQGLDISKHQHQQLEEAILYMRRWRHYE